MRVEPQLQLFYHRCRLLPWAAVNYRQWRRASRGWAASGFSPADFKVTLHFKFQTIGFAYICVVRVCSCICGITTTSIREVLTAISKGLAAGRSRPLINLAKQTLCCTGGRGAGAVRITRLVAQRFLTATKTFISITFNHVVRKSMKLLRNIQIFLVFK